MIRLRRIKTRVPLSRLYELEVDGQMRRTRAPVSSLEDRLGVGDAWSVVDAADRRWRQGITEPVEFPDSPSDIREH
jgi:hypothetical protein